jgi:trehalose 6-phosphate phosphatase
LRRQLGVQIVQKLERCFLNNILSEHCRPFIQTIGKSNVCLAFDFDGTLAPMFIRPRDACMRKSTQKLLGALATRYPIAVISGRSLKDLKSRLPVAAIRCIVGNHGLEWDREEPDLENYRRQILRWHATLVNALGTLEGLEIENKGLSIAVHYRNCGDKAEVITRIQQVLAEIEPIHVIGGKEIFNILPKDAPRKGDAVRKCRKILQCESIIFTGDDLTDEDAFGADKPARLIGVRVGKAPSKARFYLEDQESIDDFLKILAAERPESLSK